MPPRRLERLIVKDFAGQTASGHKEKLLQSHRVRAMLDGIQEREQKLVRPAQQPACQGREPECGNGPAAGAGERVAAVVSPGDAVSGGGLGTSTAVVPFPYPTSPAAAYL